MSEIYRSDIVRVDLDHALLRKHVGAILVTGDKLGNRFGAEIFRDGNPVDVAGCGVTAYFMRPGEDAIVLNGTASGSVAYVDLAQACYSKASSFTLTIKISYGGATTALRVIDGYILLTQTDDLVDPGDVVPTLDDIFAQIAAMEAATERAQAATADAIAAKDNANGAAVYAVNIATEKGDQAIQLAQEEADKQNVKIDTLTQEMVAYKGNIFTEGYDFNTAPANSFFYMLSRDAVNAPPTGKTAAFGFLVCYKSGENFVQIYTDFDDGKDYIRYGQGNAWVEWKSQKSVDALETEFNTFVGKTLQSRSSVFTEGYDFNAAPANSFFYMLSRDAVNAPLTGKTTAFGFLVTYKVGTTSVQIYTDFDDGRDYIRYFDGSSWTSWKPEAETEENGVVYVSTAEELYNTVRGMGENTHVFINPGTYDVSTFIEADETAQMNVKKGCVIEGLGDVRIICHKTTPSDVPSIFNFVRGDGEIKNLYLEGSNIRYLVHDDMGGTSETPATHKITNCVLNYVGESWDGFAHPRCIGGGTGNNVVSIIENCVLTDTNDVCIDYHSNYSVQSGVQPTAGGKLIITNCYSATSRIHLGSLTGDLGENPTVATVSNNCMGSELTHSGNAFDVKAWNNVVIS